MSFNQIENNYNYNVQSLANRIEVIANHLFLYLHLKSIK